MSFVKHALIVTSLLVVGAGVSADSELPLTTVGASLPAEIYQHWFSQMANSSEPRVSYRSVGSDAAQWALIRQAVDFAVSTAPMQPKDLAKVRRGVVQIPTMGAAIAFGYNQPDCNLRLTQQQAVQVANGKITDWKQLGCKPGALTWVHRSDASGITNAFTRSMQAFSSQWSLGTGMSIHWPAENALAAEGNSGVVTALVNKRGSIGYLDPSHLRGKLRAAALQNSSGEFIRPDVISGAKALKDIKLDSNLAGINHNPPGEDAYPIVTLIRVLAYRSGNGTNTEPIRKTLDFILSRQAQNQVAEFGLIPLNDEILGKSRKVIERIGQ